MKGRPAQTTQAANNFFICILARKSPRILTQKRAAPVQSRIQCTPGAGGKALLERCKLENGRQTARTLAYPRSSRYTWIVGVFFVECGRQVAHTGRYRKDQGVGPIGLGELRAPQSD